MSALPLANSARKLLKLKLLTTISVVNFQYRAGTTKSSSRSAYFKIGVWVLICSAVQWLLHDAVSEWPGLVGGVGSLWPGEGPRVARLQHLLRYLSWPRATCTDTAAPLVPALPRPLPLAAPRSPTDTGSLPPNFASHISWSRFFTKNSWRFRCEMGAGGVWRRPTIQRQHCCKNV